MFHYPEEYRITEGELASDKGQAGAFRLHWLDTKKRISVFAIASTEYEWEHVSVSHHMHIPYWLWMCKVKSFFWDDEDAVMQYHAPKSEWISNHPRCLHLWRPTGTGIEIPKPPSFLVGLKQLGEAKC